MLKLFVKLFLGVFLQHGKLIAACNPSNCHRWPQTPRARRLRAGCRKSGGKHNQPGSLEALFGQRSGGKRGWREANKSVGSQKETSAELTTHQN
jgi:hypothetical protein